MLSPIDEYFLRQEEPYKSCLQFLRNHLLNFQAGITETWKYGMPFYNYNGKRFAYLWTHKKFKQPYIGFIMGKQIAHPDLLQEDRKLMKILLIDPAKDMPLKKINGILKQALLINNG
jgi:hypothetical protein